MKIKLVFNTFAVLALCFVFGSCRKCIRCSYDNNFGDRVTLQEYCGKSKDLEKYKDAYKDYPNFTCEDVK